MILMLMVWMIFDIFLKCVHYGDYSNKYLEIMIIANVIHIVKLDRTFDCVVIFFLIIIVLLSSYRHPYVPIIIKMHNDQITLRPFQ